MPWYSKCFLPSAFGNKIFNTFHLYASPRSFISYVDLKGKDKAIPLQAWARFQEVEAPRFQDSRHMKMVRLSALRAVHFYPQEIFLVLISVLPLCICF
jgi:hypothetical protein